MKENILFICNKLKTIKKRVWAIIAFFSILLAYILLAYWVSLSEHTQMWIKADLGSTTAKEYLGDSFMKSSIESNKCDRSDAIKAVRYYLDSGTVRSIHKLLAFPNGSSWNGHCPNEKISDLLWVIDRSLEERYKEDYTKLENLALALPYSHYKKSTDPQSFSNLLYFYIRTGNDFEGLQLFDKMIETCEDEKGDYCLSEVASIIGSFKYNDEYLDESNANYHRMVGGLIWLASIDFLKKYSEHVKYSNRMKYLLSVFLWDEDDRDKNEEELLTILNELANKNYGPALVLLGKRARQQGNYELAETYFIKATTAGELQAYLMLYDLYDTSEWTGYHSNKIINFDDKVKIAYLERARVNNHFYKWEVGISYYSARLAYLYFKSKQYDKAIEMYEKMSKQDPTLSGNKQYIINALTRLGDIYYQGLGQRQDLKKALDYYGRACDLKDQEACDKFREVNEKIR